MSTPENRWRYRGTCYKFGDDLEHDGQMIAFDYVIKGIVAPEALIPHLFETTRPDFHRRAKPGDIIVAGKHFGKGKAHRQAYIAMKAMGLAVACESLPYNTYLLLVGLGLPFMTRCAGIAELVEDGDDIEIDFHSGRFFNHTRSVEHQFNPLPERALEIIGLGGTKGMLRDWWAKEQAASESRATPTA
jgi:3-isopropylmalate/(R)-2-methylmalate dehydratase small subunit